MRNVGLPEIPASAPLRSGTLTPVERVAAARPAAAGTQEADAPAAALLRATAGETPPVDNSRVAEIRRALEDGNYPLIPARIADAMIAARLYAIVGE